MLPGHSDRLTNWAYNKYYLDHFYEDIIVKKFLIGSVFNWFQKIDTYVIDGIVNGLAAVTSEPGGGTALADRAVAVIRIIYRYRRRRNCYSGLYLWIKDDV